MLKNIFFLIAVFLFNVLTINTASAQNCTNTLPQINVLFEFEDVKFNHTTSIQNLTEENSKKYSEHSHTMGLSKTSLTQNIKLNYLTEKTNFQECTQLKKIDIILGLKNRIVYVAKEIPQNTCFFNEVLNHEKKHVQADEYALQINENYIKKSMQTALLNKATIVGMDEKTARKKISDYITQISNHLFENVNIYRDKLQANIDSPEEYKKLSKVCNGQGQKYIK